MNVLPVITRRHQRGVGMIEMMVAMMLGAIIIIGVTQLFTSNRQTFRMQDGMAVTQESGTFAVDFLSEEVLRAGLLRLIAPKNNGQSDRSQFDWANTADGGNGGNDRLAVVYQVDTSLTPGMTTYCTGEALGGATWISNRYWVDNAGNLMCQGATVAFDEATKAITTTAVGTPQALVSNVESFQVLYGVNLNYSPCPTGAGAPTAYVTATQIAAVLTKAKTACPDTGDDDPSIQWASTAVRSVRISMLLRTENQVGVVNGDQRTYTVLEQRYDSSNLTLTDGRLRRQFTRTVLLRNQG